jgi:hypothetical protein
VNKTLGKPMLRAYFSSCQLLITVNNYWVLTFTNGGNSYTDNMKDIPANFGEVVKTPDLKDIIFLNRWRRFDIMFQLV